MSIGTQDLGENSEECGKFDLSRKHTESDNQSKDSNYQAPPKLVFSSKCSANARVGNKHSRCSTPGLLLLHSVDSQDVQNDNGFLAQDNSTGVSDPKGLSSHIYERGIFVMLSDADGILANREFRLAKLSRRRPAMSQLPVRSNQAQQQPGRR